MVAPGFLQTPRVREWLNGIEPAWTLLDFDSFNALRHEPSRDKRAIRLAVNTSPTDIAASPVASNTLTLLHLAEQTVGLKLTATSPAMSPWHGTRNSCAILALYHSLEMAALQSS